MTQILTASRLKAFRQCARLHQYRYIECRVPFSESGPARFGTLFHAALEAWWSAYQLIGEERLRSSLSALRAHATTSDEEELAIAEELLLGYHLRYCEDRFITQLVEHEFNFPLINPLTGRTSRTFVMRGKIDAKVLDEHDGRSYLVEHKTTSQDITEGSSYWQRLRMDGQVSVYYDAFPDVAGCIYDVIRRPGQRRLKATPEDQRRYTQGKPCKLCVVCKAAKQLNRNHELCAACKGSGYEVAPKLYANQRDTDESLDEFRLRIREAIAAEPESYYKRGIVVRLAREIHEHQADLWIQAKAMAESLNNGWFPRNPDSCIQFNRICDYFDVCTGVASLDDERLFHIRDQHPELSKETK